MSRFSGCHFPLRFWDEKYFIKSHLLTSLVHFSSPWSHLPLCGQYPNLWIYQSQLLVAGSHAQTVIQHVEGRQALKRTVLTGSQWMSLTWGSSLRTLSIWTCCSSRSFPAFCSLPPIVPSRWPLLLNNLESSWKSYLMIILPYVESLCTPWSKTRLLLCYYYTLLSSRIWVLVALWGYISCQQHRRIKIAGTKCMVSKICY